MRQEGYYWVKYDGEWEIAYFSVTYSMHYDGEWSLNPAIANETVLQDSDFEEINENRIVYDQSKG